MRLVNCFDYALCKTEPIPEEHREEAYKIYAEESFYDFLLYLNSDLGIITDGCMEVFNLFCFDYDLDEENYYELNLDRTNLLLNILFDNNVQEYADRYAENEI